MKVLLRPMCYRYTYRSGRYKASTGCIPASEMEHVDLQATKKACEYEKELSRQLLKDLMTQRDIPYDEKEAKIQSLWRRYGKYAGMVLRIIPGACDA